MTFPTFEGGDFPELPIEMPQEASTPVRMHFPPEFQSIRLLASTIFTFIKAPQFQHRLQIPAHKVQQHNVVSQLISKFNPSFIQLAVLSQQSQPPVKVEKPATVSPPKESGNQRDETASKTTGKDLVSIEVFAGEQSQSNQQNFSGQQGGKSSAENTPVPLKASSEATGSPEAKPVASADMQPVKPASQASTPAENKSAPSTDKNPSEAKPDIIAPESKAIETKPFLIKPAKDKSPELSRSEAKGEKSEAPSQPLDVSNSPSIERNLKQSEVPAASSSIGSSSSKEPSELSSSKQADSTTPDSKPKEVAKSPVGEPKVEGKDAEEAKAYRTNSSVTEKTPSSDAAQSQQPSVPPKSEIRESKSETVIPSQAIPKVEGKEASEKMPLPLTEKLPEKNEPSVQPLHQKKEPQPIELIRDKPGVEEAVKQQHKETLPLPVAAETQIVRKLPEEAGQASQLKIFQAMDRNANVQIPPWLAMLLPDLNKAESASVKGGGGKSGTVVQNPYKLSDMLFILLCAHLAGAKSLLEVIRFMEAREKWLTVVLGLRHGLPPRQLFFWLLVVIDANQFDYTIRRWLREIQGIREEQVLLLDVVLTQTPLGFIIGQQKHPDAKQSRQHALEFVNGFLLENCLLMVKSESSYGSLLSKIDQRGGKYIAEVEEELIPPDEHELVESYIEGQEKIVALEWMLEGQSETQLKVLSEIFDPRGIVQTERFYLSSLKNPADYYFDLSRLQRPYENKLDWLLNVALSLPSIDASIQRCNASLVQFQNYAEELIANGESLQPVEKQMQKAAEDNAFLLELTRL